ncbi:Succinate semialdehyde dehydrogenase [NAD(P)+] Sad [Arenibacter antarcticus]|uniref:Aldehyde dehydrogenase family protein n=1 Tax=Arenibacter antarcticus TaxID=2040469 RepID=A0ABW5VB28_9FLAO|nr:aldehyde dehydrogenase family protein [Arenibacter sp. H213]MCM4167673.1 aldehyde dehydrogenase [Arenibacter sp. H213]
MIHTISPIDGSIYYTAEEHGPKDIEQALNLAESAFPIWADLSIAERATYITLFVDAIVQDKNDIALEITWQMGRPLGQSPGEIKGFADRAHYMIKVAEEALSDYRLIDKDNPDKRWVERVPIGVVSVLSPWNYPFLTSVNAIVPALMAGNVVILKHSFQTPLVAERYAEAAAKAGLPKGVFQIVHLNHKNTAQLVGDGRIKGVYFTGSVKGGIAIQNSLLNKFIPCGLELGGKDPAYVMADANVEHSVENLVDGAFFNSGQSCCGIERIYVHESLYDKFVDGFVAATKQYKLGNPLHAETNLGPMVKTDAANYVRKQIAQAMAKGAKSLVPESLFAASKKDSPYLSPHVLVNVDHSMEVMTEESFGPVVGIMKVKNDEEAIRLMNDSQYGLTASLWGTDMDRAISLGKKIETGTVFMNRCDYLDPALAWTGVKNSGSGVTLSKMGYDHVTRVKSFNFRKGE